MDQYSVGRFRKQNPIQPFQPRELSEVEKERILSLAKVFAIDTATQSEIEPYYRNMVSQLRVGGLGVIDTPIPPSSSPFAEKKENQLPPEFFTNLAISGEAAETKPSEPTTPKTDEEKLSFFQRFSRKTGGRSDIEEQAQKDFGDVGALSMDKSGNFRLGTMGFYESSAAGSYAGSRLELLTSNQGVVASSNRLYNSTSLFETSPAWKPKVEQIPGWNAKTNEQGDVYYTDRSGNPVTFGSLGSSLIGNDPDEPVGPNSIIGYENGNPVLAKDAMPILATVTKLGLETYLRRNEFEESFYNYNLDANNNWTRYKRAGDYGAADPSVLGFVDPNNVPIVDFLFSTLSGTTTNPDEVARELSPKINANLLVDLIIERDPELFAEMVKAGADPNTLRSMQTAGEFRGYVNRVFINNSIARSLSTIEKTDGWWWDKFYKGSDMLLGTLTSGDFVGQLEITVASGGTNLLTAGGLRVSAMASARTAATGATRAAALRTAIGGSTRVASEIGRATSNVVRWLPANIPTTLLEKTLSRLPSASNYIQNMKWYTRLPARGGIWAISQAAEGFVEEGFTDVVNQNYEIALGLRESFDWEQLYHSSVEGALMEPVLGGIIGGASIPVHLSGRAVSKGVVNRVASIFNLSKSRMQELSLYMDTLNGRYENLSPIQQQIRLEQVVRGIVLEDTLGSVSEGRLSRAETAIPVLSQIAGQLRSTEGAISTGNLMEAGVLVSKVAEGLQTNYNTDPTSLKDLMEADIVSKDTGNGVKFTEDGAIALLTLVGAGMRADTRTNALTIMARESTNKAIKEHILKVNSELAKKLKDAQQSGKAADLAQAESDLNKALSDFLNSTDENDKKIVDSISGNTDKRMKLLTSLLEQTFVKEGIETVINQDTQDSIETSNARLSSRFGNFFMQLQDILDAPARKKEEARQARIAERRKQDFDRMSASAQAMAEESARGLQTGKEELEQAQQRFIDMSLAPTVGQPAAPTPTVAPTTTEVVTPAPTVAPAAPEVVTPPPAAEPTVTPVIASTAPAEPVVTAPSTPITSPDPVTESQVYSKEDAAAAAELENLGYTKDEVGRFKQLLEANNLSLTYVLSLIEDVDDINDKKELLNSLTKPC